MIFCTPVALRSTNYMFNEANLQPRIRLLDCSEEMRESSRKYLIDGLRCSMR